MTQLSSVELAWRELRESMGDISPPELMTPCARMNSEYRIEPRNCRAPKIATGKLAREGLRPRRDRSRNAEVSLKAWLMDEVERTGLSANAIYVRVRSGRYRGLQVRRESGRGILVRGRCEYQRRGYATSPGRPRSSRPLPGEMTLADWVRVQMRRLRLKEAGVWGRLFRGTLQRPPERRVNGKTVFVKVG